MTQVAIPLNFNEKEEIFTHLLDGVYRHFPVRVMLETAKQYADSCEEIISATIPICKKQSHYIHLNIGIEQARLDRLGGGYLYQPLIAIQWNDTLPPEITIIDGNHRYVKLAQLGIDQTKCYIFKRPAWEQMLLPAHPAFNMLGKESRLLEHENTEAICESFQ